MKPVSFNVKETRMPKNLVIVESPAKAKTINKILGKDFIVKASYGHVRDLPKKELGIDIEGGFIPTYEVLSKKKDTVSELKKLAKDSEVVFLCSDPAREGEAISWNLFEVLKLSKSKARRVTFNEITPSAITNAFKHPRDIDMNLVNSQQARRMLDRLVGYKLSPILWQKIRRGLSAGRVQSVAVRLLAEREKEIAAFKPEEYWTIKGSFEAPSPFLALLRAIDDKRVVCSAEDLGKSKESKQFVLLASQAQAIPLIGQCEGRPYEITEHEVKSVSESPYPPFNTSMLQQAAANRLGFDAKRTMAIAQGLYEGVETSSGPVGLITYMRTDSFNVSQDALKEVRSLVQDQFGDKYCPAKPNFFKSKAGAQEAHECVRPTHVEMIPDHVKSHLTGEQFRLYELIWKRFVASHMTPALYEATSCEICPSDKAHPRVMFRATGRVLKFDGWTKIYEREEDEDGKLPPLSKGAKPKLVAALPEKHVTQPPPRYTEASLVKILEKEGIGRPSTYATILSTIQERQYAEKVGKGGKAPFKATELGLLVTECLTGRFKFMDVGFTRDMEEKLDEVEEGKVDHVKLLEKFFAGFKAELDDAKKDIKGVKAEKTDVDCPKCGKKMLKKFGRFGYFLACENEKCKHSMNLDGKSKNEGEPTDMTCDKCGKPMLRKVGRFGPYLCCSDYPKDCQFTMRINKVGLPTRKAPTLKTSVKCAKCDKEMVLRMSRKGSPFLGCSGFPKCRNIRSVEDVPENLEDKVDELRKKWLEGKKKDEEYASKNG